MATTSQASNLEGIHREMYGITEQIRVMNEINACQVQHLATNNPPPPTAPVLQMVAHMDEVKAISIKIKNFKIRQIHREENKKANALANLVSAFDLISDRSVPLEFLISS